MPKGYNIDNLNGKMCDIQQTRSLVMYSKMKKMPIIL